MALLTPASLGGLASVFLAFGGLAGCTGEKAPAAEIEFPPHPCLWYTAAEIRQWKADPKRQDEIAAIVRRGEAELETPIVVPEQGGQWPFYYACPKDGSSLVFVSEKEHRCPTCGKVYTDERTIAAYRTSLHNQVESRCHSLALAYALTGDDRFAVPVRDVFLRYAELYPKYERHDRWGRTGIFAVAGGRRYCQHLEEAIGIIRMAKVYDLVYDSKVISPEQHKRIEEDFILATAREILKFNVFNPGRNNHQSWFNAAYTVAGIACRDKALVNEGINGEKGFHAQLRTSLTSDGLWYEGTISYHFYALQALEETVDAARRIGIDLAKGTRLKDMFLGPMQIAYPNGQLPAMHDSDPASLSTFRGHYQWAYRVFGDPAFKALADGTVAAVDTLKSAALEGAGIVCLRRGKGSQAVCAMLDYGEHGEHHGHPDKLNLMLYALGREIVLDPGRLSYSVPEHISWSRQTVAHNTVVVNRRSQSPARGKLLLFEENERYAACLATGGEAYAHVEMRRFLLLTEGLLIDVFALVADREMTMDWILHGIGKVETGLPLAEPKEPIGKEDGYQHLADVKLAPGSPTFTADWRQADGQVMRVHFVGDQDSQVYTGTGIGYNLTDRVPFLLRRRAGKATCFTTVYDLAGKGAHVSSVSILPLKAGDKTGLPWQAIGLRVERSDASGARSVLSVGVDMRTTEPPVAFSLGGRPVKYLLVEDATER